MGVGGWGLGDLDFGFSLFRVLVFLFLRVYCDVELFWVYIIFGKLGNGYKIVSEKYVV